jgi:[acyl-carrier-protein] S-malonyltransferase
MAGAKAVGAKRAIPLAVSIAAHSKLMAGIQDEWNAAVEAAHVQDADVLVIGNVAGRALTSAADLRQDIQAQMQSRVRWTETIQLLTAQGVSTFVEVGTGNVLLGLTRRIAAAASGFPLGTPADFAALE